VLIWFRKIRYWILAIWISFHLAVAVTLILPFFSLMMLSAYPVFLSDPDALNFEAWLASRLGFRRSSRSRRGGMVQAGAHLRQ